MINCNLSITWLFSPIFIHWGLSALAPGCGFHFVDDPGVIVDCFLQFVYMIAFVFIVFPHIPSLSITLLLVFNDRDHHYGNLRPIPGLHEQGRETPTYLQDFRLCVVLSIRLTYDN